MDHVFTIMSLNTEYLDEICQDIKEQVECGVASCALFSMTLVPEGNPPANKAKIMCEKYMLFKEKLDKMGVPNGVLVQATIGHGYVLGHPFPYQRYIGLVDGKDYNVVCPYDEGFRDYIYDALRTVAQCAPHHIMIDDDYRLIHRGDPGGCACPLHMKRFGELSGADISREQLLDIFQNDKEHHEEYNEIFLKTQGESLIETAKVMRAAIDSVDPKLPASFCTVGNNAEFAAEIAGILAGEGNPVTVRLSNGNYTPAGARLYSIPFYRAATQIAKLKDKVDIFLAETDTCPPKSIQHRCYVTAHPLYRHAFRGRGRCKALDNAIGRL